MTSTLAPAAPSPASPPRPHRGRRIALAAGAGLLVIGAVGVGAVAPGVALAGALRQDTVSRSFSGVREIVVVAGPVNVGVVDDPAATRTIFARTVSGPIDVVAG